MLDYDVNERAVIGDNAPDDAFVLRSDEIAEYTLTVTQWLNNCPVLETQEQADQCANFIAQLRDKKRACEADAKAEIEELEKPVNAAKDKWRPLSVSLKTLIDLMAPMGTAYLAKVQAEQRRIADEKRRLADEAVAAAKRANEEAQKAIREAQEGQREGRRTATASTVLEAQKREQEAAQAVKEAEAAEKAKPTMGGGRVGGRARTMGLRKGAKIFTIIDRNKAIRAALKLDAECLNDAIIAAAKRWDAAGKLMDGMEVTEGEAKAV